MVAKIMKSSGSMRSPLDYNEHKVDEGTAKVVGLFNMDGTADPVHDTFSRLEIGNIRSREVSFHMSINPGPGEHLSEGQVQSLVRELMEGLGYGSQPFVIYQHNDIEREHYHVVSIRVDEDGRKIPNYMEQRECLKLLESLSRKYGFTVGKNGEDVGENVKEPPVVKVSPECFLPGAGNVIAQMEAVAKDCCTWRMTSTDQFVLVMKEHGIRVTESPDHSGNVLLKGLDSDGKPCTAPVDSRRLSFDLPALCRERIVGCLKSGRVPEEDLDRISRVVLVSLLAGRDAKGFTACLDRAGVRWECIRDPEGIIRGATFVDRATKSVFNISELHHVGLRTLQKEDASGWTGEKTLEDIRKQPSFAEEAASAASLVEALLSSMTGGMSREHDMKGSGGKNRGRRR